MGEFRIYGRISGAEKKEILKEIDDADFEVEIDPGQTIETYVRSKNHSSNKIKKVVNSVIKLPNESLNQNHVVNFERFEKIFEQVIKEKKKIDQDGDGDKDFIDAKIAQYMKGGMTRSQAISKAKEFAKKNGIKEGLFNRWFKPSVGQAAHDQLRGQGYSHRGTEEEGEYIMHDGEKYYADDIEYDDYYSTKPLPRVENGKLIIANPNWSNE
jgi:hypothetical protein